MEESKNPFPFRLYGRPDKVSQPLLEVVSVLLETKIGETNFKPFSCGEYLCHHTESIRDCDVYVFLQPRYGNVEQLAYDLDLGETMILALKQGEPYRITAIIPSFPYSRQDKSTNFREPVLVQKIAMRYQIAGANRIVTLRMHNPSSYNAHSFTIPIVNVPTKKLLIRHILKKEFDLQKFKIVSPDLGAAPECRKIAQELGIPGNIIIINKFHDPKLSNKTEVMEIIGDPRGYNCIIPDDIADTCGTAKNSFFALKEAGALDIYFAAVHPILSGNAIQNLAEADFKGIWFNDTCDLNNKLGIKNLEIIPTAKWIAEIVTNLHNGGSITDLSRKVD